MKLNKLQRFTAYCIMMQESEGLTEKDNIGFHGLSDNLFDDSEVLYILTELNKKSGDWAGLKYTEPETWPIRRRILAKCIRESHP